MRCMYCGYTDSKVIDSRQSEDGTAIRRRRECMNCGKRFTTYETVEMTPILVVKADGTRQSFDPNKIKNGVIRSCEKRPVPMWKIDKLVEEIQKSLYNSLEQEVSSQRIGEMVMAGLKDIDEIAYVRFASVYRQFKDISTFMKELEKMQKQDGSPFISDEPTLGGGNADKGDK
ncbi:MAG: transcriptional repressor NrdR [Clostridia bacterium]|nr:transcriptional repressor NrdR [Clostridia bacterium]